MMANKQNRFLGEEPAREELGGTVSNRKDKKTTAAMLSLSSIARQQYAIKLML